MKVLYKIESCGVTERNLDWCCCCCCSVYIRWSLHLCDDLYTMCVLHGILSSSSLPIHFTSSNSPKKSCLYSVKRFSQVPWSNCLLHYREDCPHQCYELFLLYAVNAIAEINPFSSVCKYLGFLGNNIVCENTSFYSICFLNYHELFAFGELWNLHRIVSDVYCLPPIQLQIHIPVNYSISYYTPVIRSITDASPVNYSRYIINTSE